MMIYRKKGKAQSILEYALLLGVIAAGILIMQSFVKRAAQGRLKDSADRISGGSTFSAGGTSEYQSRKLTTDQEIVQETATDATMDDFTDEAVTGTIKKGVYSSNTRTGGDATSETKSRTDAAVNEKYKWDDYQKDKVSNFDFTEEGDFELSE